MTTKRSLENYKAFLPCALAFFQRALAIADKRALAAALKVLRWAGALDPWLFPLILAHRARAPAAILARAAALIILLPVTAV